MPAENSGIWPATVRIREEGGQWTEGEWNTEKEGSRATSNKSDI